MNENETKAVKLCLVSIVFIAGMWLFFGIKNSNSNYEYKPLAEYNTLPEYSGL